jgi:uncharacterized membrane protein YdjX (TVP38/TMEM64 family)
MTKNFKPLTRKLKLALGSIALVLAAAAVYILIRYELFQRTMQLINEGTPTGLFIILMLFLPMVGVPLSLFLFVLGIKFGLVPGLLLLEAVMPVHFLLAFALAHWVRKPIEDFLIQKRGYRIPKVPPKRVLLFSFLFLTFPAFPYAVKIYGLPLAGAPFRYCFWLNWAIQGTLCIPFVLLGRSAADLNFVLLAFTLAIFVVLFFVLRWMQNRYQAFQKEKIS